MFDDHVIKSTESIATGLGLETAALLAIADVESGGAAFALVDGRNEPLIRFEGHYFDQRLGAEQRRRARAAGLASPIAGAVANPATQAGRWRLLAQAAAINQVAAHESSSWGLGQVMGAHWQLLGFGSVGELVAEARSGVDGQIRLMARYIDKNGLAEAIRAHDWQSFARAYNGPAYARNAYHTRIAAAYERYRGRPGARPRRPKSPPTDSLAGSDDVRHLQRMLCAAGHPVDVDGAIGPATRAAIRAFQSRQGLDVDCIAGPETLAALGAAMPLGNWPSRVWNAILGFARRFFGRRGN